METGLQLKTLSDELVKPRISRFKAYEAVVNYVKHQLKGTLLLFEHALYHDLSTPMDLKQRVNLFFIIEIKERKEHKKGK